MSATIESLPRQVRAAAVLTWFELPRVLAAGALWLASGIPLAVAALAGAPWWLTAVSGVPIALLSTGLARFADRIRRGDPARIRDLFRVDALLALLLTVAVTLAAVAIASDAAIAGFAIAAVLLAVAPSAIGYGAVRSRTGFAALRGGAILAAYRPGTTVTLLSLGVLGGFAVVATAGVLALVVPGLLAVLGTMVAASQLVTIDPTLHQTLGVPAAPVPHRLAPRQPHPELSIDRKDTP